MVSRVTRSTPYKWLLIAGAVAVSVNAFSSCTVETHWRRRRRRSVLFMSDGKDAGDEDNGIIESNEVWDSKAAKDSNVWFVPEENDESAEEDWQDVLKAKQDGTFWSSFESSEESDVETSPSTMSEDDPEVAADSWLETLASLSAEESAFNQQEAERANKVREMEEWGFDATTISSALDVATDTKKESEESLDSFRQTAYADDYEDIDWSTVESHKMVEMDPDSPGEPIRQQHVYVDEHSCIGCTNCAMIAQSTFYMNEEHGRARVFQQWGDDDETIQIAIETCPVDCIHYVPYDELVKLEKERRNQNINFKARLVSQSEYGGGAAVIAGSFGATAFTGPQKISGNEKSRCNNCPSRGCRDCPMFGVGKNPEFERREKERLAKRERMKMEQQREEEQKSAEL